MKTIKRIHPVYKDWEKYGKPRDMPLIMGKYRYIYSSDKGEISLVEFPNYFGNGNDVWEIYCLKGKLFDDVERYDSKEKAEKRIKELLR